MSKRAIRRSHYNRLKIKRYKQLKNDWWYYNHQTDEELLKDAAFLAVTPRRCSCSLCGNQRHNKWLTKWEQLTQQERRSKIDEIEQINEWGDNYV